MAQDWWSLLAPIPMPPVVPELPAQPQPWSGEGPEPRGLARVRAKRIGEVFGVGPMTPRKAAKKPATKGEINLLAGSTLPMDQATGEGEVKEAAPKPDVMKFESKAADGSTMKVEGTGSFAERIDAVWEGERATAAQQAVPPGPQAPVTMPATSSPEQAQARAAAMHQAFGQSYAQPTQPEVKWWDQPGNLSRTLGMMGAAVAAPGTWQHRLGLGAMEMGEQAAEKARAGEYGQAVSKLLAGGQLNERDLASLSPEHTSALAQLSQAQQSRELAEITEGRMGKTAKTGAIKSQADIERDIETLNMRRQELDYKKWDDARAQMAALLKEWHGPYTPAMIGKVQEHIMAGRAFEIQSAARDLGIPETKMQAIMYDPSGSETSLYTTMDWLRQAEVDPDISPEKQKWYGDTYRELFPLVDPIRIRGMGAMQGAPGQASGVDYTYSHEAKGFE